MKKYSWLLLIASMFLFTNIVFADESIFNKKWSESYDTASRNNYVSDVLKVEDGLLTISTKNNKVFITLLTYDGIVVKNVDISPAIDGRGLRLFEVENGYIGFAVAEDGIYKIAISSDFEVTSTEVYNANEIFYYNKLYAVKIDNEVYFFTGYAYDQYLIKYDFDDQYFSDVVYEDLDSKASKVLDGYFEITTYDYCKRMIINDSYSDEDVVVNPDDETVEDAYCAVFEAPYNGGYIFSLYEGNKDVGKLVYYKDDEVWTKVENNVYYGTGAQVGEYFVLSVQKNDNNRVVNSIDIIDSKGEVIDSNAFIDFFITDIIPVDDDFIVSGSMGICKADITQPKRNVKKSVSRFLSQMSVINNNCDNTMYLAYFEYNHIIETKTDGNGTVTANKIRTSKGTEVEFTIEPKKGYVLGTVKVTDANGNVLTINDYKFIMPDDDVLIEATFLKEPMNPLTATGLGLGIIAIAGVSGYYAIKQRKKLK